jgi:hypothetical protein
LLRPRHNRPRRRRAAEEGEERAALHGSSVGRVHAQWVRREGSTPQSRRQ